MDQTATESQQVSTLKDAGAETGTNPREGVQPNQRIMEKDLVVWTAPARPFKRRDRRFWVTILAISAILGLILFVVEGFMPVVLIISLVFLFYIMNTVEPETIEYKITNFGVKMAGSPTSMDSLLRFWFTRRFDSDMLVFQTIGIPGRLEMVVGQNQKENIRKVLLDYMPEEEVPPSTLDKAAIWFSKKMPGSN